MYPYHVFDLEPAGTFGTYPICYRQVSGGYIQPEPAMYSRCFHWFPGPLAPSAIKARAMSFVKMEELAERKARADVYVGSIGIIGSDPIKEPNRTPTSVLEGGPPAIKKYN